MFKTVILLSLLLSLAQAQEEFWSGCGESKVEAKNRLAENILVKVESSVKSEVEVSISKGLENVESNAKVASAQSSTMMLSGLISYQDEQGNSCVKVSREDLKNFTTSKVALVSKNYDAKTLPTYVRERAITIDEWLISLKFLKGLSEVFSKIDRNELNTKIAELKNIRNSLATQYVKINVHGSQIATQNAVKEFSKQFLSKPSILKIDGKTYNFSQEVFLKVGEHTFDIQGEHCRVSQAFDLGKNSDETISIDLDDYAYPQMSISANKSDVRVRIDGASIAQGKLITFEKCTGSVHYELNYASGKPKNISDSIDIYPSMKVNKNYSFLSSTEINNLNKLVESFNEGKRLEFAYNYVISSDTANDNADLSNLNQFSIAYMQYKNWLRHGAGLDLGLLGVEDSYQVQLTYMAAFQLTTFGAEKKSLRLGSSVGVVPYMGLKTGLAYANLYNSSTQEYNNNFIYEAGAESNFLNDNLVFKALIGSDFLISKTVAIGLEFSKAFTMQKSYDIGMHISLGL